MVIFHSYFSMTRGHTHWESTCAASGPCPLYSSGARTWKPWRGLIDSPWFTKNRDDHWLIHHDSPWFTMIFEDFYHLKVLTADFPWFSPPILVEVTVTVPQVLATRWTVQRSSLLEVNNQNAEKIILDILKMWATSTLFWIVWFHSSHRISWNIW